MAVSVSLLWVRETCANVVMVKLCSQSHHSSSYLGFRIVFINTRHAKRIQITIPTPAAASLSSLYPRFWPGLSFPLHLNQTVCSSRTSVLVHTRRVLLPSLATLATPSRVQLNLTACSSRPSKPVHTCRLLLPGLAWPRISSLSAQPDCCASVYFGSGVDTMW